MAYNLIILDTVLSSYDILCFGSAISILCILYYQIFSYRRIFNVF